VLILFSVRHMVQLHLRFSLPIAQLAALRCGPGTLATVQLIWLQIRFIRITSLELTPCGLQRRVRIVSPELWRNLSSSILRRWLLTSPARQRPEGCPLQLHSLTSLPEPRPCGPGTLVTGQLIWWQIRPIPTRSPVPIPSV